MTPATDLRYPIGPYQFGHPVSAEDRPLYLAQLAEGHVNWYVRPKLAITESKPIIKPFDESLWAELPDARSSPVEPSLMIFEGIHARWILFFQSLQPEDWSREFMHPERGMLTI